MRLIIAGSRSATQADLRKAVARCKWVGFASAVVSGTARGADQLGEHWAEERGLEVVRYPAEWEKYGRRAGPFRNKVMAEHADGLVALWDGTSKGTRSMIELALDKQIRVFVYRTDTGKTESHEAGGTAARLWDEAEERAAILEFSGGLSREDAERTAGLQGVEEV